MIPEMRAEIMKWCTAQEKGRLLRTCKYLLGSVSAGDRQLIRRSATFEQHMKFGNYVCLAYTVTSEMWVYVSEMLGNSHKYGKWLYSLSQLFMNVKCTMDTIVYHQVPDEPRFLHCYYSNVAGKAEDPLIVLLGLVPRGKRRKPVSLNGVEIQLWRGFCQRLRELTRKLAVLKSPLTYDLYTTYDDARVKREIREYKRFETVVGKILAIVPEQGEIVLR